MGQIYLRTWHEKYRDSCQQFLGSRLLLWFSCAVSTNAQTSMRKILKNIWWRNAGLKRTACNSFLDQVAQYTVLHSCTPTHRTSLECHLFKWKEATTGSFCIVSCFVLSWWELHLLHLELFNGMTTRYIKSLRYKLYKLKHSLTWFWTWSQGVPPGWTCSGRNPRKWWNHQQLQVGPERCPRRDQL